MLVLPGGADSVLQLARLERAHWRRTELLLKLFRSVNSHVAWSSDSQLADAGCFRHGVRVLEHSRLGACHRFGADLHVFKGGIHHSLRVGDPMPFVARAQGYSPVPYTSNFQQGDKVGVRCDLRKKPGTISYFKARTRCFLLFSRALLGSDPDLWCLVLCRMESRAAALRLEVREPLVCAFSSHSASCSDVTGPVRPAVGLIYQQRVTVSFDALKFNTERAATAADAPLV